MIVAAGKTFAKGFCVLALLCIFNACIAITQPTKSETQPPPTAAEKPPMKTATEPVEPLPEVTPKISEKEVPPPPFVHKVRWPGEMLTFMARWYTGAISNWKAIAAANPTLDPHRIFIGDEIIIPDNLLKTRTSMPRNYLPASIRKKKASTPPSAQPDTKSGEIELFGPVGIDQKQPESAESKKPK